MKKLPWLLILGALITAYLYIFIRSTLVRHWSMSTYYYDLGIMHQTVYNSAHGLFLQMTDPNTGKQISRLAIHFDPLMLIFTPIYWIYPHVRVLLVGQTAFLASGAIPIFLLARLLFDKIKKIPVDFIAVFFSFLYLSYFPLQKMNLADFHAVALVTPLLLWALYFIEAERYLPAVILLIMSAFGKENVALVIFMMGLYILFIKKNKPLGLSISIISVVFFVLVVGWIIPSNRENIHFAASYYTTDIATNFHRLFSPASFQYIFKLLEPVGFLSLFSPLYLLIAAPEWLINLLSKNVNMRDLQYHYAALLIPFIFLSSMYGLRWIINRIPSHWEKKYVMAVVLGICAIVLACNLYTLSKSKSLSFGYVVDKERLDFVRKLASRFDRSVPLSATGHLAPHFSGRQYFYNFLFDFAYESMDFTEDDMKQSAPKYEYANYIIIQKGEIENKIPLVRYYYEHLRSNGKFELVLNKHGIEVYHRKGTPRVSLEGL